MDKSKFRQVRRPLLLVMAAFVSLSSSAQAFQYRWVDEKGTVHYSQFPPPKGQEEIAKPPSTPTKPRAEDAPARAPRERAGAGSMLIGKWESVARSKGGLGHALEFHRDGSLSHTTGAMVEETYRVEGSRLITSSRGTRTGKVTENVTEIRFEGDTLIQKSMEAGGEVRMSRKRSGGPQAPPIVGIWSYPHYAGGTALVMFTRDGRMIFRLPIRTDRGNWSIAGNLVTIALPGSRIQTLRYKVEAAQLTLTSDQAKEQAYKRADLYQEGEK